MDPAAAPAAPEASAPHRDLLRLLTCGSADDGKSTLIGRLLHDSHHLYDDRIAAVYKESAASGHAGGHLDLALLPTGSKPSGSRASPSTSPTSTSPPPSAASSLRTLPATSSTPATW